MFFLWQISRRLKAAVQELGDTLVDLVQAAGNVQNNPTDVSAKRELSDTARQVASKVSGKHANLHMEDKNQFYFCQFCLLCDFSVVSSLFCCCCWVCLSVCVCLSVSVCLSVCLSVCCLSQLRQDQDRDTSDRDIHSSIH